MSFIKNTENFVCEKCGQEVVGNGYTNHCPNCLWSKHVDISPGDRLNTCRGMMEPIGVDKKGSEYIILHKCIKCGLEKPNKAVKEDNFQMIIQVSSEPKKK
jgi:DNA-directed RNA polymerase subunit RPC12/RpoP